MIVRSAVRRGGRAWWRPASIVLPLIGVTATLGLWWSVTAVFDISPLFLPGPPDLVDSLREPGRGQYLLDRSLETAQVTLLGFGIAMSGGFVIALLLATFRSVERAIMPVLVGLNAVPKVGLAPLLVVWLGFEIEPKVVLVVLICFFPIVVATMSGLASTPAEFGELTASLAASRWQAYRKVRVPWALPQIFVGLKLAVPLAVIGAVVAETNNPNSGLGSAIVKASAQFETALAFVCLVLLALLSSALFYLVVWLERRMLPWARAISAQKW
ncbi:ABC transporter permease [Virgisporangium aliadipatigenens]|uniref:ABC transporter permease n=1 Tax=Virgisporangium aliadipatigenens TaxID=741659 RepID=A0A8J4DTF8_9ACTN|nr:ABC transporter permease [Virgisporangium aliadipatigenens]GIJ49226.1 ABC transporter permease [Virgisporangium aliadipatigenens]